ncbi:MAG: hypothetical protein NC924_05660 [Candidatus Omnitrophica bacterium]|nr:hypothetical protein [Candidatus Omnitrophota bacterium]
MNWVDPYGLGAGAESSDPDSVKKGEGEKQIRKNKKFRDWFHRKWKPAMPKGSNRNRDATSKELDEAWTDFQAEENY